MVIACFPCAGSHSSLYSYCFLNRGVSSLAPSSFSLGLHTSASLLQEKQTGCQVVSSPCFGYSGRHSDANSDLPPFSSYSFSVMELHIKMYLLRGFLLSLAFEKMAGFKLTQGLL